MPPKYDPEQLLRLRESPLVCKPAGLPPIEEWMGPIPDPAQNQNQNRNRTISRGKDGEGPSNEIPAARRPPFESRAKSSGVIPEDIVLGPPRTSFASAGRKSGNALDTIQRQDPNEESQKERNGFGKFSRDGPRNERNGDQTRDSRPGASQRPRSEKTDSDVWSNARGQRTSGHEEQDRPYGRRNGERDDRRDNNRFQGDGGREGARNGTGDSSERRGWQPRSRNEPSWYKDENSKDIEGLEGDNTRPRGWRDKEPRRDNRDSRGHDRHWGGGRHEVDPEWMDEPEPEDKKQTYTQDDFEQWKARMKAGSGQDAPLESKRQQPPNDNDAFGDTASPVVKPPLKESKPLVLDSDYDGFYGNMDNTKKESGPMGEQENGTRQVSGTSAKTGKASKFSSLFSPAPEPVAAPEPPPAPLQALSNDASAEDKEGFARILSLLGGQQQTQAENGTPSRAKSRQKQSVSSPVHSPPPGMYNDPFSAMVNQQSPPPVNQMPPNTDSQFFLNLLQHQQQPRQGQPPAPAGNRRPYDGPGSLAFENMMISQEARAQAQSAGPPPGFMPDAFRDDIGPRGGDKLNPTTGAEQRRPPPGFPDMGWNPNQRPPLQPPGFPPGMQRPPGFDQFPPAGQQPPRQNQNMGPPPGFPVPPRGNAFPPGLMPGMQPERGQQFGMRPNGPGMPPPPPGFMGMNGPPPGFPNMPFAQEGGMPFGGGFGEFGGQQGFGGPPGQGQGRR